MRLINIQDVNIEIIDQVSLRIDQCPYNLISPGNKDIIDSSLTRQQIYALSLLDSEEIFLFTKFEIKETHKDRYKKYLQKEILASSSFSVSDFLSDLKYYYLSGVLGYECK